VVPEFSSSEQCAQGSNDPVGDTKSVGDLLDELYRRGSRYCHDWFDFDPLGELVDGDVDVGEATYSGLEGSG
jgi:hypothetical protein